MKIDRKNREFDDVIGLNKEMLLTKDEHIQVREYRRKLYEDRSNEDKINDILTGFRFSLKNYAENEDPDDVILLGHFLNKLLKKLNIKKGVFAEYIDISPRNINKYFNGDRKFSIDNALKLEKLFDVHAEIFLEIQIKNELIQTKRSKEGAYDKFNLKDLLGV